MDISFLLKIFVTLFMNKADKTDPAYTSKQRASVQIVRNGTNLSYYFYLESITVFLKIGFVPA